MKRHLLPIFALTILWFIILLQSYTPGTWLTGWDNLHPEFDFWLNVKRSLVGVWQEYQGLGLLGGMGHIAALPRELILWMSSLVLPADTLRYAWTFLMLLAGPLGAYALAWSLTAKSRMGAWAAGVLYLFNLNTVQTFVAPYEAFITHYAALPWLLWAAVNAIRAPGRRTLFLYALISLLGMTQAYVPTLFLVYLITLTLVCAAELLMNPRCATLRAVGLLAATTVCINAIWALPFTYFTVTNARVVVDSKINQMVTQEIFLKNQKYGTLGDTLRLKNFWFDTVEIDPAKRAYVRMLEGWPAFTSSDYYRGTSTAVIILVIMGWVMMMRKPHLRAWGLAGVVALAMVVVDTPPFSQIASYLRDHVPLLSQFFRFPFTKWGATLSLLYAVSLAVGISTVQRRFPLILIVPLTILPIAVHIPMLSTPLISPVIKRTIPGEYARFYQIMKTKPAGRIAYVPVQSFWDWKYFQWGYVGSGFLWYGISQPVLDQAFNSWSTYNENYYWEISRAIYAKNPSEVEQVLTKYDIRYVLLDESIVSPDNDRSLYTDELKSIFEAIPSLRPTAQFGKLTLYERIGSSESFISLSPSLPLVSPSYHWTDNDVAYGELGDYISSRGGYVYPFRSLFTKRSVDEREFTIEENGDSIILQSRALPGFPVFLKEGDIHKQENNQKQSVENGDVRIDVQNPVHTTLLSNNTATTNDTIPSDTFAVKKPSSLIESNRNTLGRTNTDPSQAADKLVSNPDNTLNNDLLNRFDITTSVTKDGTVVNLNIHKANTIVYDSTISADLVAENAKPCGPLQEPTSEARASFTSEVNAFLRFTSRAQRGCLSFGLGNLPHTEGYLVAVESRHVTGRPLLFSLINQTAKHVELETYLPSSVERLTSYFVLPPLAPDGLGYTVYLSNDAIGRQETINDIKSIIFYRIPYQELVTLHSTEVQPLSPDTQPQGPTLSVEQDVGRKENQTLILSQSFDPGWTAWEPTPTFPFVRRLPDHVLVNNWANGWRLQSNQNEIILFFWPQLLQWLGLALLPLPFLIAFRGRRSA